MPDVRLNPSKKGAVGEALVFGGQHPPLPVSEVLKEFVHDHFEVAANTHVQLSTERGLYYRLRTEDGEKLTTQPDGGFVAEWIPPEHEDQLDRDHEGRVRMPDKRKYSEETAMFPAEVKTGSYAELERDQKAVLEGVAEADQAIHPVLIQVAVDGLPEQYEVDVQFL